MRQIFEKMKVLKENWHFFSFKRKFGQILINKVIPNYFEY